jgi:hypothetical protein
MLRCDHIHGRYLQVLDVGAIEENLTKGSSEVGS